MNMSFRGWLEWVVEETIKYIEDDRGSWAIWPLLSGGPSSTLMWTVFQLGTQGSWAHMFTAYGSLEVPSSVWACGERQLETATKSWLGWPTTGSLSLVLWDLIWEKVFLQL